MDNINVESIIKHIEGSPLWERLNATCKAHYEAHNRVPSEEEYQALRNVLICQVMLSDPKVKEMMCEFTWQELQEQ